MKEVFISYKTEDFQRADTIRSLLKKNGIECWMGDKDIHASKTYTEDITKAIQKCTVFVLVLSSLAQESTHVLSELECAVHHKKRILPVIIENFRIEEKFEYHLRYRQKVKAYEDWKEAQSEILDAVKHLLIESNTEEQQSKDYRSLIMETSGSMNPEHPVRNDENIIDVRYGRNRIPVKVAEDGKYQILCYHCEEDAITNRDPAFANKIIDNTIQLFEFILKILLFAVLVSVALFVSEIDLNTVGKSSLLTLYNPFFWLCCFLLIIMSFPKIKRKIKKKYIKANEAKYTAEECSQKLYCKKCDKVFETKIPIDERKKFFFVDSETGKRHNL